MRKELARLQSALAHAPAPVYNINTTNIQLNTFGKEGVGRVGEVMVRRVLDEALRQQAIDAARGKTVFFTLFREIHSNADHPEDLTCFLPELDSQAAHVHSRPGRWETIPLDEAVGEMSSRTIGQIVKCQPFDNAERYGPVVRAVLDQEETFAQRLAPILFSNKEKLRVAGLLGEGRPAALPREFLSGHTAPDGDDGHPA